jgi:hypothetical protein
MKLVWHRSFKLHLQYTTANENFLPRSTDMLAISEK